jgi:uncharacterized protein (TIGR02453 family)
LSFPFVKTIEIDDFRIRIPERYNQPLIEPAMAYFDKDYNQFFKDLAKNNHKDWFHENKKRYEKSVKDPFKVFTQEIIDRVKALEPEVTQEPKDAVHRINRDIRFSKDKTPYKTKMSAIVSAKGRKSMDYPGLFFELGPEQVAVYGGAYMAEKDRLLELRETIAGDIKGFQKVINDKGFVAKYGSIHGDKNKRIDKHLMEAAAEEPLIMNKGFYYYAKFDPKIVTDPKLADVILEHYAAAKPVRDYLRKGLGYG